MHKIKIEIKSPVPVVAQEHLSFDTTKWVDLGAKNVCFREYQNSNASKPNWV